MLLCRIFRPGESVAYIPLVRRVLPAQALLRIIRSAEDIREVTSGRAGGALLKENGKSAMILDKIRRGSDRRMKGKTGRFRKRAERRRRNEGKDGEISGRNPKKVGNCRKRQRQNAQPRRKIQRDDADAGQTSDLSAGGSHDYQQSDHYIL